MSHRIHVTTKAGMRDPSGESIRAALAEDLDIHVEAVRVVDSEHHVANAHDAGERNGIEVAAHRHSVA